MTETAQHRLLRHVLGCADTQAFVERPDDTPREVTWAQLDLWSRRWARVMTERGLKPGDRVAVFAPSSLELIAALVAHHRLGLVHVPINTRYQHREIEHILEDSGARLLVTGAPCPAQTDLEQLSLDALHEAEPVGQGLVAARDDEDTALLIYTSGTTGRSKGVELPFRAVAAGIGALTELWQWTAKDRLVLALPLFHVHGLCIGVHGTLLHGMCAEVQPRFSPEGVIAGFQRGGTIFMGVPTMYTRLLAHLDANPAAAESLRGGRLFTSGSAALPGADHRRFAEHTGRSILERYGMSETLLTLSNPYDEAGVGRKPGTVGLPVPGTDVRVLDEAGGEVAVGVTGEIGVRGPSVMTGYFGLPEATAASYQDGYFMSGDAAFRDEDGYFRIVGRKSVDILKCGGFKISAREIEEVLLEHPNVAEAAVVGLPDAEWGQRIAAVLVVGEGADRAGLTDELTALCTAELAGFKRPRQFEIWDELPRNALGKLQKHRIIKSLDV